MKAAPFEYHAPSGLAEAAGLLAQLENAKVVAGGQSLVAMMNFRYVIVDHLVDLNNVAGLSGIELAGDRLRIGAMTRQRDLEDSDLVGRHCPLLHEALRHVGHRQTRNRGTIGGSLAHADPSAEQPAVCAAYDADVQLVSVRGTRTVPFAQFGVDFMATAIEPDEILAAIEFPLWSAKHGFGFREFARRHGDFAVVACAALLELNPDRTVARAAITLAGVGVKPVRVTAAEQALLNRPLDEASLKMAAAIAGDIQPISDIHAGPDYRRHLARVLTRHAIMDAARRAS
jgi:carbon-monoxide dehydrogenase medium subunit